jgi:cytochrome b subunit of formate dehydrogenase
MGCVGQKRARIKHGLSLACRRPSCSLHYLAVLVIATADVEAMTEYFQLLKGSENPFSNSSHILGQPALVWIAIVVAIAVVTSFILLRRK